MKARPLRKRFRTRYFHSPRHSYVFKVKNKKTFYLYATDYQWTLYRNNDASQVVLERGQDWKEITLEAFKRLGYHLPA